MHIQLNGLAEVVHAPHGDLNPRIKGISKQNQLIRRIFSQIVLMPQRGFQTEPLHIDVSILILVIKDRSPNLMRIIFLNTQNVVLIVVVGIKVGQIEISTLQDYQYLVVIEELTQISAQLVIVDTFDIVVEPNLSSA